MKSSIGQFVPDLMKLMVEQCIIATDQRQNTKSEGSECEDDDNTQLQPKNQEEEEEEECDEWESEYNKLYQSPLDGID